MPEPTTPDAPLPPTRWSRVRAAVDRPTPEAAAALIELCTAYWYPVYAFIRRNGQAPHKSVCLVQGYFARLLETIPLTVAGTDSARFRLFLRAGCGVLLADARLRANTRKRGAGLSTVTFDSRDAEWRYRVERGPSMTSDELFDRAWAMELVDHAFKSLSAEYAAAGHAVLFERLDPPASEGPRTESYAAIAAALGMTEAAVRQFESGRQKRSHALIKAEVAATLDSPDEAAIRAELDDLFAALDASAPLYFDGPPPT